MNCPSLRELPAPPDGRTGWPWTEETPNPADRDVSWPLLSIVIPSLNQGPYIEETLRSVLLQAYPRLEVVVCDDGSTDETPEIINRYERWLIQVPDSEPRGMSQAINRGLGLACGDIVTWISTDDVYFPGTFHQVSDRYRTNPNLGALIGGFEFIDAGSLTVGGPQPAHLDQGSPIDLSLAPLQSWRLHQVATFYTAHGLGAAGRHVREDLVYVMDRELLFRVCRECEISILDGTLAQFRLHPTSKSWSSRKILDFSREFADLQDDFLTGEPEEDRTRQRIKKRRLTKGYLRHGARGERMSARVSSLLKAALLEPRLLLTRDYSVRWLAALGVESAARNLLGKDPEATLARGI